MRFGIPLVFLALTAWFLVGAPAAAPELELAPAAVIPPGSLSTAPPRTPPMGVPTTRIGGVDQRCSDCHALFETSPDADGERRQHADVVLRHGINDHCLDCHDREDRNRLSLGRDGSVGFEEAPRLCARCHGTTFRDWERGTHGRTNGYWDTSRGEQRRLACNECHDPHAPAFGKFVPLPGPRTLRMGERVEGEDHAPRSPLRRWRNRAGEEQHD
jgi:hypothetical protein